MAPSGKAHSSGKAGRKFSKKDAMKKKKLGDVGEGGMTAAQKNPKAFTFNSSRRAQKQISRTADREQKRLHLPMLDKSAADPPPYIVLVQGPPKVGKSTLIKCLIRHYTRQIVNDLRGPITVVAGKARRLTFVECPNDLNALIDAAKYADLVLLCVDGSFGFEMETFEFLNLLQSHGFPKVMGVLTHLDKISDVTRMRKMKKKLKARFWTEIHSGARLFYLTDFRNKKYLHNEVKNLARFLSVMKMRPISWRLNHPYVVVDRFEDCSVPETVRENPKCDRSIYLYGYLRGCNLRQNARVHLAGVGDFTLEEIDSLLDPCPFPETLKKRGLNEKERVLYAPLTNLGGFVYDKDAVYIDIPDWKVQFSKELGGEEPTAKGFEGEAMVRKLQGTKQTIDEKLNNTSFKLFEGGADISGNFAAPSMSEEEAEVDNGDQVTRDGTNIDVENRLSTKDFVNDFDTVNEAGRVRRKVRFNTESVPEIDVSIDFEEDDGESSGIGSSEEDWQDPGDDEIDEDLGRTEVWKVGIKDRASALHTDYQKDLQIFVYSRKSTREEDEGADGLDEGIDSSRVMPPLSVIQNWTEDGATLALKNRFVSGDWSAANQRKQSKLDEDDGNSSGSDMYGDFEDLENGEGHSGDAAVKAARRAIDDVAAEERREKKRARKAMFNEQYDERGQGQENSGDDTDLEDKEQAGSASRPGKEQTYYDAVKEEMAQKMLRTREVLDGMSVQRRVAMEGHLAGTYVRMKLKGVPCEMVDCFDSSRPILLGGLCPGEDRLGCMKLRLKKHRWFPKILKTRDPLVFSVGWRRFQSLPIFAVEDHNRRIRMLKYTPEHSHCVTAIWGPISPPNTGFVAVQDLSSDIGSWRVCATGTVVEIEADFRIVKKLKLLGTPFKVQKNTAFISGMFNSGLEVSKFEGASIRTVSGIRGAVKKPLRNGAMSGGPPGSFRATFEDKVLKSDIVFLRSWVSVEVPKFCNMVTNMLFRTARDARQFKRSEGQDPENVEDDVRQFTAASVKEIKEFEAASGFNGPRAGCVFKTGDSGLGYYRDSLVPISVGGQVKADSQGPEWRRMRTVAELRRERGIGAPKIGDSEYRPIDRTDRKWLPMQIPKALIAELPIKTKPTIKSKSKDAVKAERTVVVREPHEKKMAGLLKQLRTIRNEKIRKRKDLRAKQRQIHEKKLKDEAKWRDAYNKEMREHRYKGQSVTSRKRSGPTK